MLQNMALEVAFPRSVICRVTDGNQSSNEERMSELQSGEAYHSEDFSRVTLLSGSRHEGLEMDDHWGHDETGWDNMNLYGGPLRVIVVTGQHPQGQSCLDFFPEG